MMIIAVERQNLTKILCFPLFFESVVYGESVGPLEITLGTHPNPNNTGELW